jgi:hypothetical protein
MKMKWNCLEISSNTSYCLENYAEGQFDLEKHKEPSVSDCLSTGKQFNTKSHIKETAMRKKKLELYSARLWQEMENSILKEPKEDLRSILQSCEVEI